MYKLVTILFLFISFSLHAEKIKFRCLVKSVCSDSLELLKDFYLIDSLGKKYSSVKDVCSVDRLGEYTLYSEQLNLGIKPIKIKFISFEEEKVDTIQNFVLYQMLIPKRSRSGDWFYCDKIANGYKVDYYKNGKKRIEGKFKNGNPIGILKYYDEDGPGYYNVYYRKGRKIKSQYHSGESM